MSKTIIIIGGGIIGLCSAYYLHKEGCQVSIIDQSNMDSGASYVNAGYLSPSHFIPLSAPGVMKKGFKWMLNPASPLYIKPRLDPDFLKWTLAFNNSCTAKNVKKAIPTIKGLTLLSQEFYDAIKQDENFSFQLEKKGLLMLCQTDKMLEEEIHTAEIAKSEGLDVSEITLTELKTLEPNVAMSAKGAIYYRCDSHSTPQEFMMEMKAYLIREGVEFFTNEKVEDLTLVNNKIVSLKTNRQTFQADEFVLAAGSWSTFLSKKIGLNLLLQAGKGYRINTQQPTGISIPAILAEAKVAVTPMNGFTRFAGTMEIAGINNAISAIRVETIAKAASQFYPDITLNELEKNDAASGLRPVSPDGLPYIGKSQKCSNLTMATGHAMMGWSMATATGKLVSEIIMEKPPTLDLQNCHPDRRF
ncbi:MULTISPECIES: NAD(P)/FAD-dependent oxidoreductase [Bizionia]|uniref:FAD-dependent oxidoreductase n=1 Tax=Bizionia algoritergicola TaxID=291187 RepID=A0A5D0R169_9FLAO|nr:MULTISPECIES: FAD-dependent oxidoreductase [Bizionia]OBX23065.1 amino acid dehydrogenase [Bizionia sp. APA-3]TYB74725.1 FAD-dependent oxidoreductase [Bizionia algoritergicola]